MALHGRSGVGPGGLAPLSYSTLAHWSALTANRVEPYEVEALLLLDATLLAPGTADE
jgi:hypothetical protein